MKTLFGVIRRRKLAESKPECAPVCESKRSQACQASSLGEPRFCDLDSAEFLDNVGDDEEDESVSVLRDIDWQCLTRPEKRTMASSILQQGGVRRRRVTSMFVFVEEVGEVR